MEGVVLGILLSCVNGATHINCPYTMYVTETVEQCYAVGESMTSESVHPPYLDGVIERFVLGQEIWCIPQE